MTILLLSKAPNVKAKFLYLFGFLWCFICLIIPFAAPLHAQPPVPPPGKMWLSLGQSTLDLRPPDWTWLRQQCVGGQLLRTLKPISNKVSALVIPVFDDGRCFYETSVIPFKDRNPQSIADEKALHSLISQARELGIPIYFSLDILGWQKTQSEKLNTGIFNELPHLQEISKEHKRLTSTGTLYASPFNQEVRSIAQALIEELANKFPEISGVVLDVHLSSGDILGYSEAARAASILETSLDPIDLNISNTANAVIDTLVREWIVWRRYIILELVRTLKDTYQKVQPGKKVLISGYADYYSQRSFNDYRSSQDWMEWLNANAADGVLLEGRWIARYHDREYLENFIKKDSLLGKNKIIIPSSNNNHLIRDEDYQRDWNALKSRINDLNQIVLVARNDSDIERAVAMVTGRLILSNSPRPQIGEITPDFCLATITGELQCLKDWLGQCPLLLFFTDDGTELERSLINKFTSELSSGGTKLIIISQKPVHIPNVLNLLDPGKTTIAQIGNKPTLMVIDQAGFIRGIEIVNSSNIALPASAIMPRLEIEHTAPDFVITDMHGRVIRLSDFKDKKNVLLTFFPKCFTGGCQNHLSSLRDSKTEFDISDTVIFAISVDPADVQIAFAEQWGLPFSLIPDTGRNLSILYGAATNTEQLAERQSILIDKAGIVRLIDKQVNVTSHGHDILAQMGKVRLPT